MGSNGIETPEATRGARVERWRRHVRRLAVRTRYGRGAVGLRRRRELRRELGVLRSTLEALDEVEPRLALERLVREAGEILRAQAVELYLLDTKRNVLRLAAAVGRGSAAVGFEHPGDEGSHAEALRAAAASTGGLAGTIFVPVRVAGEVRGLLAVRHDDPLHRFVPVEGDALELLAGFASLVLRIAAGAEESVRRAKLERGLYGIDSVLGEFLSLDETLDAVARAASEALGGDATALLMPAGGALRLDGSYSLPSTLVALLERGATGGASALDAAARARRPLAAPALDEDDRFGPEWRRIVAEADFRSLLAVPVADPRSAEVGLAVVLFHDARRFTDDDLELAGQLAAAARAALERSGLYEAERSARALSQQLAQIAALVASELDPAAVIQEVVARAPALLAADACSLAVLEGEELVVEATFGEATETALGVRFDATTGLGGEVAESRLPVPIADAEPEDRLDPVLGTGYRAYLGVPLFGPEDRLYGVLAVHARRARIWRDEEIEALTALAGNASAALGNAELYQRMALERERSLAILANIADGIVAVDEEGLVVVWNAAAEHITGVPATEALGRTLAQVLRRDLASDGPAPAGNRLVSIRRGREEVWLSVTEAIMHGSTGTLASRIFAFRDISAEHVVEEMKSVFVSTVSHELRAPLTSIYGFAETLLRRDVLFDEAQRSTFLRYIASESNRLTSIVDALLSVARLDSGDLDLDLGRVDVRTVLDEAVRGAAVPDGHRIVVDMPPGPLAASADWAQLRQVLASLLDNAVRFSPDGGTITVGARRKRDTVEFRVVDEGIGVSPGERERIFTKFYRGNSAMGDGGASGTGVGLFIAQGLTTAMGGRITVSSPGDRGSSFEFELPLAAEEEE